MTDVSVPLRTYRIHWHKASIEVRKPNVVLHLGVYFRPHEWQVPLEEVVVARLEEPLELEGWEFQRVPDIPYFFTTGPLTSPNLTLLFVRPQRVPPLRLGVALAPNADLPFGYRSSRSEKGAYVDGVLLRVKDADRAYESLTVSGIKGIDDPFAWLVAHHSRITQPVERQQVLERRRSNARLGLVSSVLFLVSWITAIFLRITENFPWWGWLVLVGVAVAYILERVARRRKL